jgi:hypothetical protein
MGITLMLPNGHSKKVCGERNEDVPVFNTKTHGTV